MSDIAIRTEELTKEYVVYNGPRILLREVVDRLTGHRRYKRLRALDKVSLQLDRGKTLGVIGINGAGKSTMLRLVSGISEPTAGRLQVNGRVASLLEFGAGFDSRLTARENILLNGMLLGIPRPKLAKQVDAILDYAELTDHADSPLYTFSSGMSMRLGFAIAIQTDADILLFDEVLAVGDVAFQSKCLKAIEQFKRDGKTILFVSHDLYEVGNVCDEVLLLNHGKMEALGEPHDVIQRYWSTQFTEDSRASLQEGPLRVDFVGGKLYLWVGTQQLTKGFCGYTSLRSFVRWHESDKATWRVLERSPARVVAEGRFWGLPIGQRWTLELGGNRLRWDVDIEATQATQLDRQQLNFMLSDHYDAWVGPGDARGALGPFRASVDDDWDVAFSCAANAGAVGLRSSRPQFPEVGLESDQPDARQELTIVSSDLNFRGRLLQCRRMDPVALEPGSRRPYFRGTVTVGRSP